MALEQKILDSRELPEIFREIHLNRLSGILVAERLKYRRSIYFKDGAATFATSNLSEDKIGKILFTQGKVTMGQLLQALDTAKAERKRLGAVLVQLGFISAKDLFDAVVLQVEQIISTLFSSEWRNARFSFDAEAEFGDEVIRLTVHPLDIAVNGVRQFYGPEMIRAQIGGPEAVLRLGAEPLGNLDRAKLSAAEKAFCNALDGRSSVRQLASQNGLAQAEAESLAYALLLWRMAEKTAEPQSTAAADEVDEDEFLPDIFELDHPEAGGEAAAQAETANREERRVARPVATRSISARRRTDGLTAEGLSAQITRLKGVDYFERLGLERKASPEDVITAYSSARRLYAEVPENLREQARGVLQLISDAYKTLAVEVRRLEYEALLDSGHTPQESERKLKLRIAHQLFEKAQRNWAEKQLEEAEGSLREAVELDPMRADYYIALGLVLAALERGAPEYREIGSIFSKVTTLQPDQARGYYYLATVLRRRGETAKAEALYRKALTLDAAYQPAAEGLASCAAGR